MIALDPVNGIHVTGNLRVTNNVTFDEPLNTTYGGTGVKSFSGNQLLKYGGGQFVGISLNSSNQYPITVNQASEAGTALVSTYLYDHGTSHRNTTFKYGVNYTRNDSFNMVGFNNVNGNVTIYPFAQSLLSVANATTWGDRFFPLVGTYTIPNSGNIDGLVITTGDCVYLKV